MQVHTGKVKIMDIFRTFIVTCNWQDKVTKQPMTGLTELNQGIGKETGAEYKMLNEKSRLSINGTHPIGNIITFKLVMVEPNAQGGATQPPNIKVTKD